MPTYDIVHNFSMEGRIVFLLCVRFSLVWLRSVDIEDSDPVVAQDLTSEMKIVGGPVWRWHCQQDEVGILQPVVRLRHQLERERPL